MLSIRHDHCHLFNGASLCATDGSNVRYDSPRSSAVLWHLMFGIVTTLLIDKYIIFRLWE